MAIIKTSELRATAQSIFERRAFPVEHAATLAEVLVWANLHGKDTHGVARIPRYLELVKSGELNPTPNITLAADLPAMTILDSDRAAGAVALQHSISCAVSKARRHGISLTLIKRTTHTGSIGYFTTCLASKGFAAIAAAASIPNMAYHGSRSALVSTAPLAVSIPRSEAKAITLDMASSKISWGGLVAAQRNNVPLNVGDALDEQGNLTEDASRATALSPLGGPKGSGLALMIELLASVMAGNPILQAYLSLENRQHQQNALLIAIDVSQLGDLAVFVHRVEALASLIKDADTQDGVDELLMPGERGQQLKVKRLRDGIPIPEELWKRLQIEADTNNER
ncbi:MAG: Ldh family oxidoreductase [Pseudorhodoplanes sp.]|uniref:Ldh family oxidoreductase n=1 Tax=Pseudorhodoplanes sp. TaxID=1934341 RepID=UPI003D0F7965